MTYFCLLLIVLVTCNETRTMTLDKDIPFDEEVDEADYLLAPNSDMGLNLKTKPKINSKSKKNMIKVSELLDFIQGLGSSRKTELSKSLNDKQTENIQELFGALAERGDMPRRKFMDQKVNRPYDKKRKLLPIENSNVEDELVGDSYLEDETEEDLYLKEPPREVSPLEELENKVVQHPVRKGDIEYQHWIVTEHDSNTSSMKNENQGKVKAVESMMDDLLHKICAMPIKFKIKAFLISWHDFNQALLSGLIHSGELILEKPKYVDQLIIKMWLLLNQLER